jgi:GntR family transcriptional regulator
MTELLDKHLARPLYLQLEELLRRQIEAGQLAPGERIPSEPELAETFGISRMTARRALDALVLDGALFRQPGKGTFVAEPKVTYSPATLFSFSTAMRALGLTVTTRMLDLRLIPAPPSVAQDLRLLPHEEVALVSRLRYVEGQPMTIHTSYLPSRYYARILHEDLTRRPLAEVMHDLSGLTIAASQDYVEATLAPADEAALLSIQPGAPLLLVRGVAFTQDGLPIRSTRSVYRGDHFRFYVAARDGVSFEMRPPTVAPDGIRWLGMSLAHSEGR